MNISQALKQFRLDNKLTQKQFAQKYAFPIGSVQAWECGVSMSKKKKAKLLEMINEGGHPQSTLSFAAIFLAGVIVGRIFR